MSYWGKGYGKIVLENGSRKTVVEISSRKNSVPGKDNIEKKIVLGEKVLEKYCSREK